MFASKDIFLTAPSGYTISRSVRLRSSASAYFNRTFGTPTGGNIFTWSGWVKRGAISAVQPLFNPSLVAGEGAAFNASNQLTVAVNGTFLLVSTPVYRDPSAWYHIMLVSDMGNATAALRFRVYVNGAEVTAWATDARASYTSFPYWNKNAVVHYIGYSNAYPAYADGYMTEINFIDGQALTPSSFGTTNAVTGVWQPVKYTGTYGTNGFYLNFSDNSASTATTIGKDYSGNSNNWTPNNISVTAGTTYDSMVDSPTVTTTSSNYAVLNPLNTQSTATLSNGNLNLVTPSTSYGMSFSTMGVLSGKWYWEITPTSITGGAGIGINKATVGLTTYMGQSADSYCYIDSGQKYNNNSATSYGSSFTNNDVIGVALDMDAGTLIFYKNNTSQGTAFSSLTGEFFPAISDQQNAASSTIVANFGQRPFTYTPPSGYVALNTQNLPTPTISNGANYMAATLYTGNGSTQSISNAVNSISFQPDWVWNKSRGGAGNHSLTDSVRGVNSQLFSNLTDAQGSQTDQVTAFSSSGFSLGANVAGTGSVNVNAVTYVAWQWKAGGASSSNTNGTITSTVSVGATQGFSVVTYTGTGANATVGHGLGVAPKMIIVKNRTSVSQWGVYHVSLGNTNTIYLNLTNAVASQPTFWNSTTPTSSVFSLGTDSTVNGSTNNLVAYCFSEVAGYSKFGSYTGNASTDGPMIYTGFLPRWVMFKRTDSTSNWTIWDTAMNTYNVVGTGLYADLSAAESTGNSAFDYLSNGFKIRNTFANINSSGGTYIYAAFATTPFKNSLAR